MPCYHCPGTNFVTIDAGDRGCNKNAQCGMVTWSVSLPYINLWLADAPVSYTSSLGEEIAFQLFYKQRDTTPPHTNKFQPWFLRAAATEEGAYQLPSPPSEPRPFVPATGWNHNWFSYIRFSGAYLPAYPPAGFTNDWQDFGSWHATLFVPGGGTIDFNSVGNYHPADVPNIPNVTQADLQPMIIYETGTGLGPIYPCTTNVLQGGLDVAGHIGFRLVHADGSMDLYGKVTALYPNTAVADALWTEHIDPYGNSLHFYYTNVTISGVSSYLLSHVVDYDGETNYLTYNSSNLLSRVDMPYGRFATFAYDPSGNLTNITDAKGMPSSMTYQTTTYGSVEPASVTTDYGTTAFEFFDNGSTQGGIEVGNMGGTNRINRAIRVTHPDQSKELFVYRFDSRAVGISNSVTDATSPFGMLDNSFDASNTNDLRNLSALYTRNSFHWGRRQYSLVSTQDINFMTTNDYRLATMTHWLARDANTLSDSPSMIQQPSPDGVNPGTRIWFDDSSKNPSTPWIAGNGINTVVCQLLPDGQTRYAITSRTNYGMPVSVESTYEMPGGQLSTRTINYAYEELTGSVTCDTGGNQIASQNWTNYALSGVSGPGWETHFSSHSPESTLYSIGSYDFELIRPIRRELTITNAENQTSTIWYNNRQQWTGARLVNGVRYTNYHDGSGWPAQTVNLSTGATNAIAFADGLPLFRTNAVGLWTSYAWDELQRPLSVRFPDGTGYTNEYHRLNLDSTIDRLGHTTLYTANNMGEVSDIFDAESRHTELSYCSCGSLETVTDLYLRRGWTSRNRHRPGNWRYNP